MKIYYDCTTLKTWNGPVTGIPRVVQEFLEVSADELIPVIYDMKVKEFFLFQSGEMIRLDPKGCLLSVGATWNHPSMIEKVRELRESGLRYGHLFHDLIPILFPYFYEPTFDINFSIWLRATIAVCDVAFFVSHSTEKDFLKFCRYEGLTPPTGITVRLGDSNLSLAKEEPVLLPAEFAQFILCVGTLEARKNHQIVLDAVRELWLVEGVDVKLILVGRPGWLPNNLVEQIQTDSVLRRQVIHFDSVSDPQLAFLYRYCKFTVFPSIYEGWGLPIAESLSFGKPCIASDSSSMIEIGPGLTKHASPIDVDEWMKAIRALWMDSTAHLCDQILNTYQSTSWHTTLKQILSALRNSKSFT